VKQENKLQYSFSWLAVRKKKEDSAKEPIVQDFQSARSHL